MLLRCGGDFVGDFACRRGYALESERQFMRETENVEVGEDVFALEVVRHRVGFACCFLVSLDFLSVGNCKQLGRLASVLASRDQFTMSISNIENRGDHLLPIDQSVEMVLIVGTIVSSGEHQKRLSRKRSFRVERRTGVLVD